MKTALLLPSVFLGLISERSLDRKDLETIYIILLWHVCIVLSHRDDLVFWLADVFTQSGLSAQIGGRKAGFYSVVCFSQEGKIDVAYSKNLDIKTTNGLEENWSQYRGVLIRLKCKLVGKWSVNIYGLHSKVLLSGWSLK